MTEKKSLDKFHWYDGLFYDKIVAPNQTTLFKQIIDNIELNKSVIDIGCGTGYFSFSAAKKCESILGIDLSSKNINRANKNLNRNPNNRMSFRQTRLTDLLLEGENHFDYAVMTYVIHEVNEEERIPLLNEIAQIADKLIIGDYIVPQPKNKSGRITELVEFVAGAEHYRNFKNYEKNGGAIELAKKAGFTIISEIKNSTNHILVLSKKGTAE